MTSARTPGNASEAPRYRKPKSAPRQSDLEDARRWTDIASASLTTVQASAEKWRTGLAAFVTLVTGGLLIKGPEAASDLAPGWRLLLTVLFAGGLACAVAGLWQALKATAGTPAKTSLTSVQAEYGSVRQFEVASAARSASALQKARGLVALSLILLGAAVISWWWAPDQASPVVKIEVGDDTTCGSLESADGRVFRVQVAGESGPTDIPFDQADNVRVADAC